jgi:hypothetical protein
MTKSHKFHFTGLYAILWLLCSVGLLLFLGTSAPLRAQSPDSLHWQRSIQAEALFVTGDQFSNIYLVTPENALVKYDSLGKRLWTFSNNRLGQAQFIDASNPLKILVWYPDFQTVLVLDRTMTEMGRLDFSRLGMYSVRCVAMAFDGNVWAFDDAVSKAVKVGLDGSVLLESPPLNIYFPRRFSATRIRDSGGLVYLNDPTSGWCTLDQYANLDKVYNTLLVSDFEVQGDWMFYVDKEQLCLQHQLYRQQLFVPLPEVILRNKDRFWMGKHGVFVQVDGAVEVYSWE